MKGGHPGPPLRRRRRWLAGTALLVGAVWAAVLLSTPAPLPTVAALPAPSQDVPGRSPSPFGSGPPVLGEDTAPATPSTAGTLPANSQPATAALSPKAAAIDRARFDALR